MGEKKVISIYLPKDLFKKIKYKNIDDSISLADVCRNLILEKYINKDDPDLNIIRYSQNDYDIKNYPLSLSVELHKKFNIRMIEENDKSMSAIIVALLKKYYLKGGNKNGTK